MIKNVEITDPGDSALIRGQTAIYGSIIEANKRLLSLGKKPIQFHRILMGITKSALEVESFLSAASFQQTKKILTRASSRGSVDNLYGIKENVITGKSIPAGTSHKEHTERRKQNKTRDIDKYMISDASTTKRGL
jgi:DNA-directed RNA polymerase subunit beta'